MLRFRILVFCLLILILVGCTNHDDNTVVVPQNEQETISSVMPERVKQTKAQTEATTEATTEAPTEQDVAFKEVLGLTLHEYEFPSMDGSTATIPLGEAIAALMMGKNREECKQYTEFTGTNTAYKRLMDNAADIIVVYEQPDDAAEYKPDTILESAAIGSDALVFMVNVQNPIESLTAQQVVDIYSGKITNWSEVGGEDADIAAYQRNATSGSQTLMAKLVMGDTPMMASRENLIAYGMYDIITAISEYDNGVNAIGYNVHYYVAEMIKDPNIKIIAIDGVNPSKETIANGEYPFSNNFYAVIRMDSSENSPERRLFRWLQTVEGQALIDFEGYAPTIYGISA